MGVLSAVDARVVVAANAAAAAEASNRRRRWIGCVICSLLASGGGDSAPALAPWQGKEAQRRLVGAIIKPFKAIGDVGATACRREGEEQAVPKRGDVAVVRVRVLRIAGVMDLVHVGRGDE